MILLDDLQEYLRLHPNSNSTRLIVEEGYLSSLTCPVEIAGEVSGFVFFTSFQAHCYSGGDFFLYQNVARQIGRMIESSQKYEKILNVIKEKNRIMGTVAHDLRNPLAVIQGYSEILLRKESQLSENHVRYVSIISDVSQRALKLVNDLVDCSVINAGKLKIYQKWVPIRSVVGKIHDHYKILAQSKGIRLVTELNVPDDCVLNVDEWRLEQAIGNLLSNAFKFSPQGSSVHVQAIVKGSAEFEISVQDCGPGIQSNQVEKLFDEFESFDSSFGRDHRSAGLGLAIVKAIVEAHRGRITIESKMGEGARFTISIPITHP